MSAMVPIKCFFLFLNAALFRGTSGPTHGDDTLKSELIQCVVLKEQFDKCFVAKMYTLDQS